MVAIGPSLNIIPLSILEIAGVSGDRIVKQPIRVLGFEGASTFTLGHINLKLTVGSMRTVNKFHVINGGCPSYYVLLGRPWIHQRKAVPYISSVAEGFLERKEDPYLRFRLTLPTE